MGRLECLLKDNILRPRGSTPGPLAPEFDVLPLGHHPELAEENLLNKNPSCKAVKQRKTRNIEVKPKSEAQARIAQ